MSRRPSARAAALAATTAGLCLAASAVAVAVSGAAPTRPAAAMTTPAAAPGSVEALRSEVQRVPGDWPAWAALGGLELEQGRATGDPTAYAAAQAAYDRSLRLHPDGNDAALAGRAALSAAQHRFADARGQAEEALAVDPDDPQALATLTDALTELGRYPDADAAANRLDALRPGVASFTRLSYQAELRGRTAEAVDLMMRSATLATTPAQIAFARANEGLLRLATGDVAGAARAWQAGTVAAPQDPGLAALGARVAWARGRPDDAAQRFADLVARRPTVADATAWADVLTVLGRTREAATALDVARAAHGLAASAGIEPDPADAVFEADHGDAARAVAMAAQIWRGTPSVRAADAYAWALHLATRDREALPYADRALALGGRPGAVLVHRGTIRAALGDRAGARADLTAALSTDHTLSPTAAVRAAALLRSLS